MGAIESRLEQAERERKTRMERRACGPCRVCCTVLGVLELKKPMHTACANECEQGCAIYADRPRTCAEFLCLWREGWGTDAMRPDLCGFMLWVQVQSEVYVYAQGFSKDPPNVVVAYEYRESGAFEREPFVTVRRNLLGMGAVLMEFGVSDVRLFGARWPQGTRLALESLDGDPTHSTVVLP